MINNLLLHWKGLPYTIAPVKTQQTSQSGTSIEGKAMAMRTSRSMAADLHILRWLKPNLSNNTTASKRDKWLVAHTQQPNNCIQYQMASEKIIQQVTASIQGQLQHDYLKHPSKEKMDGLRWVFSTQELRPMPP